MKTTTINNVQVTEEQLRNALAEIEAQSKPFPQDGDIWFCIEKAGAVNERVWCRNNTYIAACLAIGNVYRTKEEAERVVAQRKAETKVCKRLRELEGDYVVKFDGKHLNHTPNFESGEVIPTSWIHSRVCQTHWYSTRAAWEQVISEMKDDVKVMMGVEG